MKFISNYVKKKAIKNYLYRLKYDLAKRYGKSHKYTSGQVNKTAQELNYNLQYICYAHAMYTSEKHFDRWHKEQGEECNFISMRNEVENTYLNNATTLNSTTNIDSPLNNDISDLD